MFDPHNQGITGPRFERAVRNAMLTVMERPGSTLVEVLRILSDEDYANTIIPEIKDDLVRRYWTDEIAKTQDFHKSEVLGYIVSKFDRFVTNKLTRNIFGQSVSGFNMRKIMDEQKILIVNLSKGIIGEENAQFLGLLLVPRILSSAMSRADISESQRKDFYLYVDEFQNFSTEDFAQILSEARKYRLNLIVANQYIAQIDEKIRDAVFGNVGTVVSMKVGTTDAQFLETIFTPIF
ncbi:MAG: AAA-like domain protein [candidate division WS6 bacterium OLB21]|nr:MAG: AAA-like domain protein [candidate division WS6 bacterium OLB21]